MKKPNPKMMIAKKKMDEIIAYWQELGVDGFRAEGAQMVPPEFWRWLIGRSHVRQAQVYWVAEAFEGEPARVPGATPRSTPSRMVRSGPSCSPLGLLPFKTIPPMTR